MSFAHPLALAGLVIVPLLAWLWLVQDRRRSRAASAFTNLALLPNLVERAPGRLRFVPPALFLVAIAALLVGFARPHANVRVPRREATVVLAMDVSRSMQARDIKPSRLAAAERAASAFVDRIPDTYSVALVAFGSRAYVAVPPTRNHALVQQALSALTPGEGTAIGDAVRIAAGLGLRQRTVDGVVPPESVLLLSDGAAQGGHTSPQAAVKRARALRVPVSTVLIGTAGGVVQEKLTGGYTAQVRVPPSPGTLQLLARSTGGEFFKVHSAKALAAVYAHLATRIGHRTENREVTDLFAGGALVVLLVGGLLSALRFRRVP
ncbi:MAG: VWA domain-containing protein [Actinobacteria bacterium]|nr:MAG: VWA domain-containing protein [Actinomycetota bacterium]